MNFKCKRILAIVMICVFALSGAAFAKGGKAGGGGFSAPAATTKSLTPSAPKTDAPKTEAPKTNAADQNKTNTTTNNTTNNAATANKTNTTANQTTQQSGSRWGSALRNIGLFAGGMFLGSMLSSMFGFGMGSMFADILGALFNIVLIAVVVMLLMALFRRFFGKKKDDNVYAASQYPENNIRCPNCGWVSPDRNNPPKFCPECGTRMNGSNSDFTNHHVYSGEQDAQYTEPSQDKPNRIIDITPPKDKDKF